MRRPLMGLVSVLVGDGQIVRINAQLRYLKCAELTLMIVSPRVHKMLRNIYDVLGKFLAQGIRSPFIADFAYLVLKPIEWEAKIVMKVLFPNLAEVANKIYQK